MENLEDYSQLRNIYIYYIYNIYNIYIYTDICEYIYIWFISMKFNNEYILYGIYQFIRVQNSQFPKRLL